MDSRTIDIALSVVITILFFISMTLQILSIIMLKGLAGIKDTLGLIKGSVIDYLLIPNHFVRLSVTSVIGITTIILIIMITIGNVNLGLPAYIILMINGLIIAMPIGISIVGIIKSRKKITVPTV